MTSVRCEIKKGFIHRIVERTVSAYVGTLQDTAISGEPGSEFVRGCIRALKCDIRLYFYDHRPDSLDKVRRGEKVTISNGEVVRIAVKMKITLGRESLYVDIFPTNGKPTGMISATDFYCTRGGVLEITEDEPFWSWKAIGSEAADGHFFVKIVAVTDAQRKLVVKHSYIPEGKLPRVEEWVFDVERTKQRTIIKKEDGQ